MNANNNNTTQSAEVCFLTTNAHGETVLQGQEVYVITEDQIESTFGGDQGSVTIVSKKANGEDEELTSLAWLQDTNLLQSKINLP